MSGMSATRKVEMRQTAYVRLVHRRVGSGEEREKERRGGWSVSVEEGIS